jgi:predicted DNA-binding transcriptional regulator AlpA
MQQLLTFETLVELGYVNNRVTLARRIQRGEFPAPIRVGSRNVAWIKSEIDAWQAERVAVRDRRVQQHYAAA